MDAFEEWAKVLNRPLRWDILRALHESKTQPDYSNLALPDAYPLMDHLCKKRYVGFKAIHLSVEKHLNPQGYSASLILTRPDGDTVDFVDEKTYAHKKLAMHSVALLAVQSGALQFILSGPTSALLKGLPVPVPASVPAPVLAPLRPVGVDRASQAGFVPKGPLGPAVQVAKSLGPSTKNPITLINQAMQLVHQERGVPLLKTAQHWKIVRMVTGRFAACGTVILPSGRAQCYGEIDKSVETYSSEHEAKYAVASHALETGILDLIYSERLVKQLAWSVSAPQALASSSQAGSSSSGAVPSSSALVPPKSYPFIRPPLRSPPLYMPNFLITERGILPQRTRSPLPAPVPLPNPNPSLHSRGTKRARSEDRTDNSVEQRPIPRIPSPAIASPSSQRQPAVEGEQAPLAKKLRPNPGVVQNTTSNAKGKGKEKEPEGKPSKRYKQMLIEWCIENKRPRPVFIFLYPTEGPEPVDPDLNEVWMFFDGEWYPLYDHRMSLETAEDMLAEHVLGLMGVTSPKH